MSEAATLWNELSEAWFGWLLERSVASAVVFGAVLAVIAGLTLLPRFSISAHVPSYLLLLPLLVLAVPVERLLPGSFPRPLPAVVTSSPPADISVASANVGVSATPLPPSRAAHAAADSTAVQPPGAAPTWTWAAIAMPAWALVAAFGAMRLWRRHGASMRALTRTSRPAAPRLERRFARLVDEARIDGNVGVRLARGLASPLVGGVRRPTVYLPVDLAATLSPAQLQFVIRHELEHVRRHDALTGTLVAILQLAFWFHPGVWLASGLLARWREYACDEAALARASGRRTDIADTLFTLVERACDPTPTAPAHALLLSPRNFMKHRLLRILDTRRSPRSRMSWPAALLLVLASVGTLTTARPQQPAAQADRAVAKVTPAPQDPIAPVLTEAARWLLQNQQPDGSWRIGADPDGHNQRDHNHVCITAMSVMALLPGLKHEDLKVAQALRSATQFLEASQQANGRFGSKEPMTMMYAHAYALRALCAVQRQWPDQQRLDRIERGVSYAMKARNPYMGWRYVERSGDNDSKITALMLLALHDARSLGLTVDPSVFKQATGLLDQLTAEENGRTGFVHRGQTMSRFTSKKDDFPGELSEEPTAMNLLVRHAAGEDLAKNEVCRRGIALVAALPPEWDEKAGSIDLAYWAFGAELMAIVGGPDAALWKAKLHAALIPTRIVEDGAAHWPTVDAWSHPGMEAYTTASAMLALRALR